VLKSWIVLKNKTIWMVIPLEYEMLSLVTTISKMEVGMLEIDKDFSVINDAELVARAREGSQEAFGMLITRHYRTCVNIASFILRDRSDAEDEVQKACCKAFEHLDQYHGDAEFLTWLLRIVSNQCLMLIRVRRRVRFLYIDADPDREKSSPVELPATLPDPEHEVITNELQDVLRTEISHIPPLFRNVLLLRDVQDLPMLDVAARLKITVPAAKSRLLRARSELRDRVMRHCGRQVSSKSPASLRISVKPHKPRQTSI
jgi:RNA polymerase sigma-70 factor (ECF subfamily)